MRLGAVAAHSGDEYWVRREEIRRCRRSRLSVALESGSGFDMRFAWVAERRRRVRGQSCLVWEALCFVRMLA
jgi:hypothetical protein